MRARTLAGEIRARLKGMPEAALEARLIVQKAGGLGRERFYQDPDLEPSVRVTACALTKRRLQNEPTAYLTGEREFFGLPLEVHRGVLIPRPETERLVEIALAEAHSLNAPVIVDVGTGSGAIAIAVALNWRTRRGGHVIATDTSDRALAVAARNSRRLGTSVTLLRADLLGPVERADIVVANLPYVPSPEIPTLQPEISRWEPREALDGGPAGLSVIRRLVGDCGTRVRPRLLGLEVGAGQAGAVGELAEAAGSAPPEILPDLSGKDRYVVARWR